MDYAVLTEFRQVCQRVLNAGTCPRPDDVRKLGAHAVTLGGAACAHELGFFSSLCERLHLARYFPSSHRYAVLMSPSIQPSSKSRCKLVPTRAFEVSKLAAHFASFNHAWRDDRRPCVENALSNLRSQYQFILNAKPQAAELPVSLHGLISRAKDALAAAEGLTSVIADGDALLPVDEGLHAHWAVIRAMFTNLRPVLAKAAKLALFHDISYADAFRAKCLAFRMYVVNREVDLPSLDTPLGKGAMTRVSEQLSPQLLYLFQESGQNVTENGGLDDDDEDVEWDDEVELAPSRQLGTVPLHLESDDEIIEKTFPPDQSKPVQQEQPPWMSCIAQPKLQTQTPAASAIDKVPVHKPSLYARGKDNKTHNKNILEALNTSLQSDRNPLTQSPSEREKRKPSTARDRLAAKLGIKKKKRQRSYALSHSCSLPRV